MKQLIVVFTLLALTACANTAPIKPVWQQEIEQIGRQWSQPAPIVQPPKAVAPVYGYSYVMSMNPTAGMCRF